MTDQLIQRARKYEESVRAEAAALLPGLVNQVTDPFHEALRLAAKRLVPSIWTWRIEACYGGQAVFFITGYQGE